jgi:hypothetical protein
VGICSYLLVNFWYTRIAANQSSISALLTNRVGDCFLTIGMFAVLWGFGDGEEMLLCSFTIIDCVNQFSLSKKCVLRANPRLVDPNFITGFSDYYNHFRNKSTGQNKSTECRALMVWGTNLTSQVGTGRFTKQVSNMIKLPAYQKSVIIGLLLSDGWLTMATTTSKNARLGFGQSAANSRYIT